MSLQRNNSADLWLQQNLGSYNADTATTLLGSPNGSFQLYILPRILAISAIIVAAMWYQEARLGLMSRADYVGYPALLTVTTLGALLLKFRPATLRVVMVAALATFLTHQLAVYYLEIVHRLTSGAGSDYEMTIFALWLPFGYVGSFVFFPPQTALRISLVVFAAISLPQLYLLGVQTEIISHQISFAILIAQPLYIAALRGVGMLKSHASGVQDLATNMRHAASVDALTGVANRRAVDHVLERVITANVQSTRPLALLMLDVDHFKNINDTYGHAIGDEVLIRLAQEINNHLRATDLLGRWGGEEFMVIALDQSKQQALQMAERLRHELENITFPQIGKVTISIGVTCHIPGDNIDIFISRADRALYLAKERGRNCVEGIFEKVSAAAIQPG